LYALANKNVPPTHVSVREVDVPLHPGPDVLLVDYVDRLARELLLAVLGEHAHLPHGTKQINTHF
jgi:hypothetical protein